MSDQIMFHVSSMLDDTSNQCVKNGWQNDEEGHKYANNASAGMPKTVWISEGEFSLEPMK